METDQVFISFGTTGVRTTTRTMNLSRHPFPETKIKITLILINSLLHKASKYHQDHERAPRGKKKKETATKALPNLRERFEEAESCLGHARFNDK